MHFAVLKNDSNMHYAVLLSLFRNKKTAWAMRWFFFKPKYSSGSENIRTTEKVMIRRISHAGGSSQLPVSKKKKTPLLLLWQCLPPQSRGRQSSGVCVVWWPWQVQTPSRPILARRPWLGGLWRRPEAVLLIQPGASGPAADAVYCGTAYQSALATNDI